MTPAEIAAAMVAAYSDRYERTGSPEEPIPVCLAAALRAMQLVNRRADLLAVINELEGMG